VHFTQEIISVALVGWRVREETGLYYFIAETLHSSRYIQNALGMQWFTRVKAAKGCMLQAGF
jgi:hypothetical protein